MRYIFRKTLTTALQLESKLVLWKYNPKIIAITGSVGKTSTKDVVYAVLSKIDHVRKSEKSFNSEIGLPLTVLGLPNGWNSPTIWIKNILKGLWLFVAPHKYPKWLVLEVGIGKEGDMDRTASWLHTDVVIITAIGETPAHIEFFSSKKHLIEEKSNLIKTLKKEGLLVLNADDDDVMGMKSKTKSLTLTYGFREGADVLGLGDNILYDDSGVPEGLVFRADLGGDSLPVKIEGVFGRNHAYAALASLAVAHGMKWNILSAIDSLKNYEFAPGRMCLLKGLNNSLIIDDTYNSSPFACEAALKTLGEVKSKPDNHGRKIAVLGDMLELGKHTIEAHKNIGKIAKDNVDILVVVGPRAEAIKEGAIEVGMDQNNIFQFTDSVSAGEYLKTTIQKRDMVLIKGSQGMRMERTVGMIIEDQKNKTRLLVRQSKEWLAKK